MADHNVADLLEAFDDDYTDAEDVSGPIAKCLGFIVNNTGLLGDYNDGKANLSAGAHTVMVTARTSTMRVDLHQWVQEQEDLRIAHIGIKKRSDGTVPHIEIKAD